MKYYFFEFLLLVASKCQLLEFQATKSLLYTECTNNIKSRPKPRGYRPLHGRICNSSAPPFLILDFLRQNLPPVSHCTSQCWFRKFEEILQKLKKQALFQEWLHSLFVSEHFSLKPWKSARPQRKPSIHKDTCAQPAATLSVLVDLARRILSRRTLKVAWPSQSWLRWLCFMAGVPPFCSILFGVERGGYYFFIRGFLKLCFWSWK